MLSKEAIQFYEENPEAFGEDILNHKYDKWQSKAFKALVEDRFVAIRAGSGVGKSFWLSDVTCWFLCTKPFCRIPTTAPSQHQLFDILWASHHRNIRESQFLSSLLTWTGTRVSVTKYAPDWYAVARTARVSPDGQVAEGLQGFHCFSQDTEILTYKGWKHFYELQSDDEVLSLNPETGEASYYRPSKVMEYDYDGMMYTIKHQNLAFCVTPNHKMLYKNKSHGKYTDWKLDEIQNITYRHWFINNTFIWKGKDFSTFDIPAYQGKQKKYPEVTTSAPSWFYFLGFYLAEGYCTSSGISLSQKGDAILPLTEYLADQLGFVAHTYNNDEDLGVDRIDINSPQLKHHLEEFGTSSLNKFVPQYVKDASPELIRRFLNGYLHGDGHINKKGTKIYYTSSKRLADDIQELIFKVGGKASVRRYTPEQNQKNSSYIRGKLVQTKHDRYRIAEYVDAKAYLTIRRENLYQVPYKGKVYCVDVSPHHLIFTRRNGFCMWSGNSEENLMFIVDEASGVPDAIFPAIEGALTGKKAYCILTSNPTKVTGYFYNVFNSPTMQGLYKLFHVDSRNSPFVEERYLKTMLATYGEDHPIYQIKVKGEFPNMSDTMLLFAPEDIEKFRNNGPELYDDRGKRIPFEFGLDIARSINKTILCIRKGYKVLGFEEFPLTGGVSDSIDVTNWVAEYIQSYSPNAVKVDANGIGVGVYDNLKRLFPKIVKPVYGQAKVPDAHKNTIANLRALGYWNLRSIISYIYCKDIPHRLLAEMGTLHYNIRNGKILIESKHEMGQSPDYLDAMMYAFLDDEYCAEDNKIYPVSGFGSVNRDLNRQNSWSFDRYRINTGGLSSKWSVLYH